ncbi:hypothetical protein OH77DRAFT_1436694 [Trametes cingulata]|nr:hypothetical protein OH77DRAFT_1436694 [Trametes cingulata]
MHASGRIAVAVAAARPVCLFVPLSRTTPLDALGGCFEGGAKFAGKRNALQAAPRTRCTGLYPLCPSTREPRTGRQQQDEEREKLPARAGPYPTFDGRRLSTPRLEGYGRNDCRGCTMLAMSMQMGCEWPMAVGTPSERWPPIRELCSAYSRCNGTDDVGRLGSLYEHLQRS